MYICKYEYYVCEVVLPHPTLGPKLYAELQPLHFIARKAYVRPPLLTLPKATGEMRLVVSAWHGSAQLPEAKPSPAASPWPHGGRSCLVALRVGEEAEPQHLRLGAEDKESRRWPGGEGGAEGASAPVGDHCGGEAAGGRGGPQQRQPPTGAVSAATRPPLAAAARIRASGRARTKPPRTKPPRGARSPQPGGARGRGGREGPAGLSQWRR